MRPRESTFIEFNTPVLSNLPERLNGHRLPYANTVNLHCHHTLMPASRTLLSPEIALGCVPIYQPNLRLAIGRFDLF